MAIFYDGFVKGNRKVTGNFSDSSIPVELKQPFNSPIPNSGGICNSPKEMLEKRFTDNCRSGDLDVLSGVFTNPANAPQSPLPIYSSSPFNLYSGPTAESANTLKNDIATYDKLHHEYLLRGSPRIIVYRLDREQTNIDDLYGNASGNEYFKKGVVVQGKVEFNPILQELTRFGIDETEDIMLKLNLTHCLQRIGRPIDRGDLIVVYFSSNNITLSELDQDQYGQMYYTRHTRKIFRIVTAIPTDLFLYTYMAVEANAQKTNLDLEVIETQNWDDVYELDDVPPDLNLETPDPVPPQL